MMFVAQHTGGQAFLNSNDLVLPIGKVQREAAVTYTLGFYPDSAMLDSKRHALKVDVDRKGVSLQYRPDYSATPGLPGAKIPEKAQIAEAVWSAGNATGITVSARVEKVDQPQPGMLRLSLLIDGRQLTLQPGEKGYTGALAMVYDERAADGKDLGRISETLNLQYDADQYGKLATEGISYQRLVHPAPQASQLRIVVFDRGSGNIGSVTVHW